MINVPKDNEETMNITMSLPRTVLISSMKAAGCILAEDLISPVDRPPFDQSAADGYAVKLNPTPLSFCQLINEIQTGAYQSFRIEKKSIVRIYKGDPVPPGTDCIITREDIITRENRISVKNFIPRKGDNIRFKGADIQQGNLALRQGTRLNAASIRLLYTLGIDKVKVVERFSESAADPSDEINTAEGSLLPEKTSRSGTAVLTVIFKKINIAINKILTRKMMSPK